MTERRTDAGDRPNVLWIMTDQHAFDALGCAGHPVVETPNLDTLAAGGVRFTDAYCPAPLCGPSRVSLFSGLYPSAHGATHNWLPYADDVALLPELLSAAGYHTARVGKLHHEPITAPHGFEYQRRHDNMNDRYNRDAPWTSDYVRWLADERFGGEVQTVIDRVNRDEAARTDLGYDWRFWMGSNWRTVEEHSNTWVSDESVAYLEDEAADREPFFLFASYFGPHQPYDVPGKWGDLYDPDDVPLPAEFHVGVDDKPIARENYGHRNVSDTWTEAEFRAVLAAYYG